jgi:hypothetical protein
MTSIASETDASTMKSTTTGGRSPPSAVPETVTSITARTLNPGEAVKKIYEEQGSFYTLWQIFIFLLEALGLKQKNIEADYEHVSLDEVEKRGKFPYRPSDLFLKVIVEGSWLT